MRAAQVEAYNLAYGAAGDRIVKIIKANISVWFASIFLISVTVSNESPGIHWFSGDVDAAFTAAAATHRPVLLYWGAKWCPPCQQLKSSVFARNDFIQKSAQFVAVYLDGDEPEAQRWGQTFDIGGYPTVVVLRADRREITRISGGMNLALYTDLLDIALADAKPMREVIATMRKPAPSPSKTDCRRLAYYAWDLKDYSDPEKTRLADDLNHAAAACPDLKAAEHARLVVASASLLPTTAQAGKVLDILGDKATTVKIADVIEGLGDNFFDVVKKLPADARARFQRDWSAALETVASDPTVVDADQLAAIGAHLAMEKAFSADGKVPVAPAEKARARVSAALGKRFDPYVRAGIVNSASYVYSQTGDIEANYALLKGELATAKAPYYYMADLGEIEEGRGNSVQALAWHERAYRESQGTATRFQWGNGYLSALLRLAPADTARIRAAGLLVIGELDGAERIQARSRFGLEKLDARLRKWNDSRERDSVVQAIRSRMQGICRKLPPSDGGLASCRKFLS